MNKRIYFFIGTTAEFLKLAPIIYELKKRKIKFKIISSGQNTVGFQELKYYIKDTKADIEFTYKQKNSAIALFIWAIRAFGNCIVGLKKEFKGVNKSTSYFIVHGDTVSSLLGAMIAKIYGHKLIHIESGLRSFNFFEPFPEEISRYIVSRLSDVHFCPNEWCVNNLKKVNGEKINTRQNTLIETFLATIKQKSKKYKQKQKGKYFVLVLHRQEHVIFEKGWSLNQLNFILQHTNKLNCALITHETTLKFLQQSHLESSLKKKKNITLIPRLPYAEFIALVEKAEYIVTDGGSNQEEAYYMGKPCLLLRNSTERIEGLDENVLLSKGNKTVMKEFFKNYQKYKKDSVLLKKHPSKIIVDYLLNK
jgi:UDP-N-acetylglucosamine 2-epimerase (non-hydrolysing)